MHHVAIMKKSWGLIPKILAGEKTIESRWYQTRRTPWNRVKVGDIVYFKNSGEPITAKAAVAGVMQFEIHNMTDAKKIVGKYGKEIGLVNKFPETWGTLARYCVLVRLESAKPVKPFDINKEGFGNAAAWLTINNIREIKI